MQAINTDQQTKQVFNILCLAFEKGDIEIKPVLGYHGKQPKPGNVFYHINYTEQATKAVHHDSVYEMSTELETYHKIQGSLLSFLLSKLADRMVSKTFTDEEFAQFEAMQHQAGQLAQADKEKLAKLPFKQRVAERLRRILKP